VTVVVVAVFGLLALGSAFTLVRVALGPSLLDRVVGTETLLAIITAGVAAYAGLARQPTAVPVVVVVALLGFISAVAVARYVGGMLVHSEGSGEDVGLPRAAEDLAAEENSRGGRDADRR
jgi:multicomponent Na+:H+ antiporter subunit F